jgi:hypothetical protein
MLLTDLLHYFHHVMMIIVKMNDGKTVRHLLQYDDEVSHDSDTAKDFKNSKNYLKLSQILFLQHFRKKLDFLAILFCYDYIYFFVMPLFQIS